MSAQDDQDVWGQYARGVKKLREKPPELEKPKKQTPPTTQPTEPPKEGAGEADFVTLLNEGGPSTPKPSTAIKAPPVPTKTEGQATPTPALASWKKEPLDLRIERNMSLGDVMIESRLDLHGQTEAAAYDAFKTFIETQSTRGRRMLLVITGKGADGASVLRANLPRWCDAPPFDDVVMAVRTAAQHHGGDGAYYVLLRKRQYASKERSPNHDL